uniref:Uncharacterized protein n=2 Tax=Meloidogyne TaxID=189290 RepID=A0A914NRV5_MELIC
MKLFPLEIELLQVIHGRYSQSKLVELERQRNCEVLELEDVKFESCQVKTIPLEYEDEEENDKEENEGKKSDERLSNKEEDCNGFVPGGKSLSKIIELERQRNCEVMELDLEQVIHDDDHVPKIIPLEYNSDDYIEGDEVNENGEEEVENEYIEGNDGSEDGEREEEEWEGYEQEVEYGEIEDADNSEEEFIPIDPK